MILSILFFLRYPMAWYFQWWKWPMLMPDVVSCSSSMACLEALECHNSRYLYVPWSHRRDGQKLDYWRNQLEKWYIDYLLNLLVNHAETWYSIIRELVIQRMIPWGFPLWDGWQQLPWRWGTVVIWFITTSWYAVSTGIYHKPNSYWSYHDPATVQLKLCGFHLV